MKKATKKQIKYTKAAIKAKTKKGNRLVASQALVKKGRRNLRVKLHVNRGDEVVVISGDDKGTVGKVLEVFPAKGKVIVEGVNMIKRHQKPTRPGESGEILEKEAPIFAAKVMLWDSENEKASRVTNKKLEDGTKARFLKTSGEQVE